MSSDHVDRRHLRITGRHRAMGESAHVLVEEDRDGATVIVTGRSTREAPAGGMAA